MLNTELETNNQITVGIAYKYTDVSTSRVNRCNAPFPNHEGARTTTRYYPSLQMLHMRERTTVCIAPRALAASAPFDCTSRRSEVLVRPRIVEHIAHVKPTIRSFSPTCGNADVARGATTVLSRAYDRNSRSNSWRWIFQGRSQ